MAVRRAESGETSPGGGAAKLSQIKLLVALDALLREGSVSGAAKSLGMQVSAVSRMLGELRNLYNDRIFIRTGQGMRPTPFAESLRLRVRAVAAETEQLLVQEVQDPVAASVREESWLQQGRIAVLPLAVTPAEPLQAAPTPSGIARRIAGIGSNAEPHRRLARYIATTAPGPGRSRPLTTEEARDVIGMILEGQADPIQVGAIFTAIQYRGATAGELAGMVQAIRNAFTGIPLRAIRPDLDWPAYLSPRIRSAPWFMHSARLVAAAGYKVLLHGHFGNGLDNGKLELAAGDAGIPVCLSFPDADMALRSDNIAYMPLGAIAPQVQSILALYPLLEMRTPLHAAVNLINPLSASASVVGAAQASRQDLYRDVARELDMKNLAVIGSIRDIAEFTPDRLVKIFRLVGGNDVDIMVSASSTPKATATTLFTQREYWRGVWSGAVRDERAEAIILHTAALALLCLSGDTEARFEGFLQDATHLWTRRKR